MSSTSARITPLRPDLREFCEPIERLTGRKVRGFISGIDTMVDGLSVEMFVLHPDGVDEPSRIELTHA